MPSGLRSAVCDAADTPPAPAPRRPRRTSRGAVAWAPTLPGAGRSLVGERSSASARFRGLRTGRGLAPCLSGRATRREPVAYDADLSKRRTLIGRLCGSLTDGAALPYKTTSAHEPFLAPSAAPLPASSEYES